MASIEKREGRANQWQVRYRGSDGKQRARQFARKADAEKFVAMTEAAKLRGEWTDPRLGKTMVGEWAEQWWATTADLRPSTRVRVRGILDGYLLPAFGTRPLASVTHLEVRGWVAELSASGLAPRSVRKVAQTLGKVYAAAVDARMVTASPCDRVPLPGTEHDEMRFLTPAEVKTLAEAIDVRYRAFVLVGAYGGLRLGELVGLRRRHVDLLRGRVEVAETGVEAGGVITFGPPKTRAGHRIVTLASDALAALSDHLVSRIEPGADALVFPAPQGGILRPASWRRRVWAPAVERAGLAPLRIHDLRHTAVSLWIASGDNPKEVSRRAGHTSVAFTLDRYGHLYPEADERARDRLDALLAASVPSPDAAVHRLAR